ncbi:snRNA-activating protein complex subunit 4 isoform X2 [Girardinichthys multiradiatus]|uniref:snRNA-activating protein complex subunit 4 isoform X2 n=1 Tax=Girardinichthys multiradiatus TaxID=208333 RepID=UPI001FAE2C01|nr:snRNA-activating protein complex subunit 4 isoform X2 [Girardinichthys multiradiatus]
MSDSLSAQRDRIQRQVEELERSLDVTQNELDLLSSETDDGSENEDEQDEVGQSPADLLAQREKIQTEIQNLQDMLGSHSPISVSSNDSSNSSDESDVGLSPSVDSCLQLNLVYQQVVQETLDHLEILLTHNQEQQGELKAQISGPVKESARDCPTSTNQHPSKMFLGSFLKPYFKDRLTGLGPPANQEAKLKALKVTGCLDDKKLRVRRWESWHKTLLIHSVTRDRLKRLMQPKLSRLDFLTKKLFSAQEADRQQLTEQIDSLEKEIQLLRKKSEEELIGERYEEHDWQKISNIDFEGTKDAEDIRLFWQNFLHPSINKTPWSNEEVQQLNEICRRNEERRWERIAEELETGRTAFMCLQMFQRYVSNSLKRSSWTPEEDDQLRELVQKMRIGNFIPYTQISYFIEGREPTQLIYRWNQVLDPSLKRGPWTKEEDRLLLQAVSCHGEKCWWKVRLEVPGRTDSACRDRYLDCLKKSIKKGPFERHEVELLKELVEKHGVGRWAKIAAEIPHRLDAQCMRQWRKLTRCSAQDRKRRTKKTRKSPAAVGGERKRTAAAKAKIRRRILNIKKEEEEQMTEEEEEQQEEEVVQYMDTDEDSEKNVDKSMEEEQEEYTIPPMEEWIPVEKTQTSTSLNFKPVELPSSCDGPDGKLVRSTVLERSGPSVITGPPPRELSWEERHSSSAMLMASYEELHLHLSSMKKKFSTPRQKGRPPPSHSRELEYELQAAVMPWIGNLLIPKTRRKTAADELRERGEKSGVSTSSIFLPLLQAMNVDTLGCREMIEQRKNKVDLLAPPAAPTTSTMLGPKRVSELLKKMGSRRTEQEEDNQRRLMLQQLEEALQEKHRQRGPILQRPPQSQQLLFQGPPQSQQLLFQGPPQSQQLLFQGPPQSQQLLFQGPPQSQQLLFQGPPQSQQLLFQGPPQSQQLLFQGAPNRFPQVFPQSVLLPAASIYIAPAGASLSVPPNLLLPNSQPTFIPAVGTSAGMGGANAGVDRNSEGGTPAPADGLLPGDSEQGGKLQESCQEEEAVLDSKPKSVTTACSPESDLIKEPEPVGSVRPYAGVSSSFSLLSAAPSDPRVPETSLSPSSTDPLTSTETTVHQSGGRKRRRVEVGGAGTGVIQDGKRLRRLTPKIRESKEVQAKGKNKRSSASSPKQSRARRSHSKNSAICPAPPPNKTTGIYLLPSQSMWVMTSTGPVPLVQAPPPALQVRVPNNALLASQAPPTLTAGSSQLVGLNPAATTVLNEPRPSPILPTCNFRPLLPTIIQSHDLNPTSSLLPPPKIVLPYKGVVKVDPMKPPPLRRVGVHFDSTLLFLEPPEAVHDWLSGKGGVAIPGARSALPYLPPCVSTLSTLSALLQAQKSLTMSSLQLLNITDKHRCPRTPPDPTHSASDEPVSERSTAEEQPDQQEEQVKIVRQLVAERFSSNPAYQLLKARFLSCFTVPALLATIHPITNKKPHCSTNQEEEDEDEELELELKKIQERGRRRRAERSLLLSGDSAASANHFSGICIISRPSASPDPVLPKQLLETEQDQNTADQNQSTQTEPNQTVTNQSQPVETGSDRSPTFQNQFMEPGPDQIVTEQ